MRCCLTALGHVFLAAAALFVQTLLLVAEDAKPYTAFHPDAQHPWNRVGAALVQAEAQGLDRYFGAPPDEKRHEALAALTEMVRNGPDAATMTPLQRAVMQHKLLMQFHAACGERPAGGANEKDQQWMAALVPAIRKIALRPEEIRKLPNNYAVAVALADVATGFDPKNPGPFLPRDLLADDGPWIGLELTPHGGRQGVVAAFHFQMLRGSTSFEVRMRHPEGRAAGAAYLKKLAEMPDPYLKEATPETDRLRPNGPAGAPPVNPETPQFPPGTAWALVHRVVLADPDGTPVISPLVEGVQVRVYRALSEDDVLKSEAFKAAQALQNAKKKDFDSSVLAMEHYHTAFEWTMRDEQLLRNKGFHLSTAEETLFGEGRKSVPLAQLCAQCHHAPGIHSVNVRAGLFHQGVMSRPPEFQPATRERIDEATVGAAREMRGWVQLRARWGK